MCWLAGFCWMPDSRQFCKPILGFWCPCMSFGMPGVSTLASWGTLGRSWDIGKYTKSHLEIQAWILWIFKWFRGPIVKVSWVPLDKKQLCVHNYFQVALPDDFWVWVWVSGFGKPSIWQGMCSKKRLSHVLDFWCFQGRCLWCSVALGPIFMNFVALDNGLKFDDFSEWFNVISDPESWAGWG